MSPYHKDTFHLEDKLKLIVKVHVERLGKAKNSGIVSKSVPASSDKVVSGGSRNISKPMVKVQTKTAKPLNQAGSSFQNLVQQTKSSVDTKVNKKLHVRFIDNKVSLKKDLRKRKTRNYAELSICLPNEKSVINKSEEHIPIYLKQDVATKPNKRLKDPFEFVPDTPRAYKKRLQNQEHSEFNTKGNHCKLKNIYSESNRDSILYDKHTHDILKRLEAKEQAKLRAKQNADKKQNKIKLKTNSSSSQGTKSDINKIVKPKPLIRNANTNIASHSKQKNIGNIPNNSSNDIECCFGFDDDSEEDETTVLQVTAATSLAPNRNFPPARKRRKRNDFENFNALTSTPVTKRRRNINSNKSNKVHIISNIKVPSKLHTLQDKNFENLINQHKKFQHDNSIIRQSHPKFSSLKQVSLAAASSTPQNINRLKMQRDNSIMEKIRTPFSVIKKVATTSTPQNQIQEMFMEPLSTPWRSDSVNVSRNPHFLTLKNTSLPSYNQDMILPSKLLEKQGILKSPIQNSQKSLVQSSMLDFVDDSFSKTDTPSKAIIESSLFDNAEFSPIKSNKGGKTPSRSPAKTKRNVFGILKPSNKQNLPNPGQLYDVDNYFGFDSFNDENEENKENRRIVHNTRDKARTEAQPTRILPKEAKNLQQNIVNEMIENLDLEYVDAREQDFPEEQKDGAPQGALFEDLEELKRPRRSYERKRARRVRIKSVDSDESEETIKPKVKRKDIRTPQEEAEFNKWVAQFNAMCEEVENHTLETD